MRRLKKLLLLSALLLVSVAAFAQAGKDLQLADQYFGDGEYEKAAELYEKLYDDTPGDYIYSSYLKCLLAMKDYSRAEKLVKKQVKKSPGRMQYGVDLGFVYSSSGQADKAKEQYEKVIRSLGPVQQDISAVAGQLIGYREIDLAIAVYKKGRDELRGQYGFAFELADLYSLKRDHASMIQEYFFALEENPGYLGSVQANLQSKLSNDPDGKTYELLRTSLLRKIQKSPDQTVFTELLLWYFIQLRDFESAFVQAKALDTRNREEGQRLISLADLALTNEDYNAAIKCYQHVISKGEGGQYYLTARMNLLDTYNKKLISSAGHTFAELKNLEADYYKTISELGRSSNTVQLLLGLAHLQAFYLDKSESAQKLMEEAIQLPGVKPSLLAKAKLELGDILLFRGDIWEATLLYSQVDKAFKNDPLGQEAKFRNARLSFYNGEFEWALAQLDVLKSATSQLISNDAIALGLIITDNTAFDTTTDALLIYSRADLLSFQNKDSLAMLALNSLLKDYAGHPLMDDAIYKKYIIRRKQGRFTEAAEYLQQLLADYSFGVLADDAMYNLALLNENIFKNTTKAMELYQKLLLNYPASTYVVDARKRYRALRGDQLN